MRDSRTAFSLLELLIAMAVIGALAAASLAGYSAITRASALNTGAQLVSDALTEARQDAMTQNMTVEVRLYDVPASGAPSRAYRALQLHWLKADGTTPGATHPLFLPASVVLDASLLHSTLIAGNDQKPPTDATDPMLNGQTHIFHFLPDGSTDLTPASPWFVTLRAATASDPAHFPSDWACITVDPTTGRVQVYRP